MNKIKDTEVLLKYIQYLIDLSGDLLKKENFNYADYETLVVENQLFMKRIKDSAFIPELLKNELLLLNLPGVDIELWGILKMIKECLLFHNRFNRDSYHNEQMRENLIIYKDQLENVYSLLIVKS